MVINYVFESRCKGHDGMCGRLDEPGCHGYCRSCWTPIWRNGPDRPLCIEQDDQRPHIRCQKKVMARDRCNGHYRRHLKELRG